MQNVTAHISSKPFQLKVGVINTYNSIKLIIAKVADPFDTVTIAIYLYIDRSLWNSEQMQTTLSYQFPNFVKYG